MCGEDNSLLRVNFQKDSHKNRAHVNGQMLGYQRLMMFEQLAAMDVSKVLRVCVDGVYFEEHDFELKNVFRRKELEVQKILQHLTDARRYTWSKDCKVGEMEFAPARESPPRPAPSCPPSRQPSRRAAPDQVRSAWRF